MLTHPHTYKHTQTHTHTKGWHHRCSQTMEGQALTWLKVNVAETSGVYVRLWSCACVHLKPNFSIHVPYTSGLMRLARIQGPCCKSERAGPFLSISSVWTDCTLRKWRRSVLWGFNEGCIKSNVLRLMYNNRPGVQVTSSRQFRS